MSVGRGPLLGAAVMIIAGCASALREPPSVAELAGAAEATRGSRPTVEQLLEAAERSFAARDTDSVRRAAKLWLTAANRDERDVDGLIGAARANVWLSDHLPDEAGRDVASTEAVQAAQWCERREPENPICQYWLGVAMGVQARERRATALDALPQIVERLERAVAASPEIEHAGPHRVLALVLVRAPGWPRGPGDPDRGLEHARLAVEADPEYPPNLFCLAEALEEAEGPGSGREVLEQARQKAEEWSEMGDPDALEWVEGEP